MSLYVTKIHESITFPLTYIQFQLNKCQIYEPFNGILKKDSILPIHCIIPGATSVTVSIDSNPPRAEGYNDSILQRQITVGSEQVNIYAKYGQDPHYTTIIKYSVE